MSDSSYQKYRPNATSQKAPGDERSQCAGRGGERSECAGRVDERTQCVGRYGERRECVRRGVEISRVVAQNGVVELVQIVDDVQGVHLRDVATHFNFFFV